MNYLDAKIFSLDYTGGALSEHECRLIGVHPGLRPKSTWRQPVFCGCSGLGPGLGPEGGSCLWMTFLHSIWPVSEKAMSKHVGNRAPRTLRPLSPGDSPVVCAGGHHFQLPRPPSSWGHLTPTTVQSAQTELRVARLQNPVRAQSAEEPIWRFSRIRSEHKAGP